MRKECGKRPLYCSNKRQQQQRKKKEEKNNNNIYCSAESNTNIYLYSFAAHSLKTNISALFA